MSIVHSYDVGDGDMFSIRHGSDNFTIIDCCITDDDQNRIWKHLAAQKSGKGITRFISTHPDEDHLKGLKFLDEKLSIINFYCVKNSATKDQPSDDFKLYCSLRDDEQKAFYLFKGCKRRWMNQSNDERKSACLNILWPDTDNDEYKSALQDAKDGKSPNNISPIITYTCGGGVAMIWMGDLETEFMESIQDEVVWPKTRILFAPHHGRDSGRVPKKVLEKLDPEIIVIGEAPSKDLNYYHEYNTITQNSAGMITFELESSKIHIFVGNASYTVNFLTDESRETFDNYIGSLT